ncbi:hypothetical protein CPX_001303 [Candidatus Phytoplasma pruni]|uniref:Uncharacterized protein n=1 Tax=Candidatus Phytoplasma pruni TaxID=479893 RepID=A0A0M1N0R4_9MOLU|nr:hypothetical protein [Candidatus Phytoplasma pruni]KOR75741.1 hypothetical protein CPX_001303 [Candidatus Phytoplasma pruni]MCQ9618780.1 hypothetical protein [Candidatus Phytoplasma pruni]
MAILMVVFSVIYISAFAAEENILESEEPISEEIFSAETPLNIESEEKIAENSDLTTPKDYQIAPESKSKTGSSADLLDKLQNSPIFHKIQDKTIALGQNFLDEMQKKILNPSKPDKNNVVEGKKAPSRKTPTSNKVNRLFQTIYRKTN